MATQADAPRIMTYEDAKKVRAAIKEVYLDDCYSGSESDETVAKRRNFPRAWVSEVRGQEFGEGENEAQRELHPRIVGLEGALQNCKEDVGKALNIIAETESKLVSLTSDLRALVKSNADIAKKLR